MTNPIDYTVAETLRQCLATTLAANPNPPAEVCLRSGREVQFKISQYQNECCSGLGWVREDAFYPSELNFPEEDTEFRPCGPGQFALRLEVGVVRCDEWGTVETIPTCAEETSLALQLALDRRAISEALCCLRDQAWTLFGDPQPPWVQGSWEPIEREGGCVGSSTTVTVGVLTQCC